MNIKYRHIKLNEWSDILSNAVLHNYLNKTFMCGRTKTASANVMVLMISTSYLRGSFNLGPSLQILDLMMVKMESFSKFHLMVNLDARNPTYSCFLSRFEVTSICSFLIRLDIS